MKVLLGTTNPSKVKRFSDLLKGYDIEFHHVSFSYDNHDVLKDVSFIAKEGEVTALVGPSGSGKSTCAKLAARLWDTNKGSIKVGGIDINTIDPEVLLSDYSMVFQDVVLFDDSIKENIVPTLTDKQKLFIYANEADVINVALFGMTAKEWRENNPDKEGNIRDYTDILHLVVLSNLEVLNASMIENNISQKDRLEKLNKTARRQINILANDGNIVGITKLDDTKMIE